MIIVIIDKSLFSPAERRQYEALIAKAVIADDEAPPAPYAPEQAAGSPVESTYPIYPAASANLVNPVAPASASSEASPMTPPPPAVTAAIARLEQLEQSISWRECVAVARRYELLGETEENLAQTLFDLKQTDEANYNAYLAALDKSLALVRKSGLFREIGKCSREPVYSGTWGITGDSVMDKIQAEAEELQRNNPELNRLSAIARAWENHPELVREYNEAYRVR